MGAENSEMSPVPNPAALGLHLSPLTCTRREANVGAVDFTADNQKSAAGQTQGEGCTNGEKSKSGGGGTRAACFRRVARMLPPNGVEKQSPDERDEKGNSTLRKEKTQKG